MPFWGLKNTAARSFWSAASTFREKRPVRWMMPLLVESARTAITTRGGSNDPWVTQLAVKPLTSSPSATPQMKTPWGILRSRVFLASVLREGLTALGAIAPTLGRQPRSPWVGSRADASAIGIRGRQQPHPYDPRACRQSRPEPLP